MHICTCLDVHNASVYEWCMGIRGLMCLTITNCLFADEEGYAKNRMWSGHFNFVKEKGP